MCYVRHECDCVFECTYSNMFVCVECLSKLVEFCLFLKEARERKKERKKEREKELKVMTSVACEMFCLFFFSFFFYFYVHFSFLFFFPDVSFFLRLDMMLYTTFHMKKCIKNKRKCRQGGHQSISTEYKHGIQYYINCRTQRASFCKS